MRGCSLIATVLMLGMWCLTVRAEEEIPTVKDSEWGYSYTCKGLSEPPAPAVPTSRSDYVFDASFDDETGSAKLSLQRVHLGQQASEKLLSSEAEELTEMGAVMVGKILPCKLAGLDAFAVTLADGGKPPGLKYYTVTKANSGETCWWFSATVRGKNPNPSSKILAAVRKSINSFTLLSEGEQLETTKDRYVSNHLRFRIDTASFTTVNGISQAFLSSRQLEVDGKRAGTVSVRVVKPTTSRAEKLKGYRAANEQLGRKILATKELEVCGREAARVSNEKTGDTSEEELWIWDGDLLWYVTAIYDPAVSKGKESLLRDALDSFKLLQPAAAKAK